MIINNPKTDIHKADIYGVNAFWIAAFYGHIDVRIFKSVKISIDIEAISI